MSPFSVTRFMYITMLLPIWIEFLHTLQYFWPCKRERVTLSHADQVAKRTTLSSRRFLYPAQMIDSLCSSFDSGMLLSSLSFQKYETTIGKSDCQESSIWSPAECRWFCVAFRKAVYPDPLPIQTVARNVIIETACNDILTRGYGHE